MTNKKFNFDSTKDDQVEFVPDPRKLGQLNFQNQPKVRQLGFFIFSSTPDNQIEF